MVKTCLCRFVVLVIVGYDIWTMARFSLSSSSPAPTLFLIAGGLVCVSVVAARLLIPQAIRMRITPDEYRIMEQRVQRQRDAQSPQLESSKFSTGDALAGIGAHWTFIDQAVLQGTDAKPRFSGTTPQRQTTLKQAESGLQMQVYEANIVDATVFKQAIASAERLNTAGREGYLIPDVSGGSSLLLMGSRSFIVVTPIPNLKWKQVLPEALTAYIATVSIP